MHTAPTAVIPASIPSTIQPVAFFPTPAAARAHVPLAAGTTQCSTCRHRDLCLPGGLPDSDVQRLDGLAFARRRIREGQSAYHEGDAFRFLYAVRSGTFKCTATARDGREQVTAFRMAGEIMGLEGVADGTHATAATALEDAEVCAIPYAALIEEATRSPGLQHVLSRLMGHEIVREHHLMVLLGSMNAEERVAAFLLNVSQRMQDRGFCATDFHLRMSRAEIGSYLGLTLETVSRTFSAFQHQGLLGVDKKHVRDMNLDGLRGAVESRLH
jgi:CRP/FNR family transcriptional regulator, anaerobic regulatory protein